MVCFKGDVSVLKRADLKVLFYFFCVYFFYFLDKCTLAVMYISTSSFLYFVQVVDCQYLKH